MIQTGKLLCTTCDKKKISIWDTKRKLTKLRSLLVQTSVINLQPTESNLVFCSDGFQKKFAFWHVKLEHPFIMLSVEGVRNYHV